MPARHNPTTRFEIAWEGSYNHRFADVTPVMRSYTVTFGCRPGLDGRGVRTSMATGSLVMSNRDRRFDPDSPRLQVPENSLRRRNPCRLLLDGEVAWEGLASYNSRRGDDETGVLLFSLEGKYARKLLLGRRVMNTGGGDCASLAQRYTNLSGIPLEARSDNPVGLVYYQGTWLDWLEHFGRYAGGWCLENQSGDWKFLEFASTPNLPLAATLGLEYEPDGRSVTHGERVGWVRNYAECVAQYWAADQEETALATKERSLGRLQRVTIPLVFERSASQQPLGWTRFEVSPSDIAFVFTSSTQDVANASVTVLSRGYAAVPPQKIRITGYGRANRRKTTDPEKVTITEFDTQDVYERQELRLPPWFPSDFNNLGSHFKPWLRNLSQPAEALQVTYDNRQLTRSQANTLRRSVVPGNAVDVTIALDGRIQTKPLAILGVRLSGNRHGGTRTVSGIVRRELPPAPLAVNSRLVTDQSAVVQAYVQSPALEPLYMRIREA